MNASDIAKGISLVFVVICGFCGCGVFALNFFDDAEDNMLFCRLVVEGNHLYLDDLAFVDRVAFKPAQVESKFEFTYDEKTAAIHIQNGKLSRFIPDGGGRQYVWDELTQSLYYSVCNNDGAVASLCRWRPNEGGKVLTKLRRQPWDLTLSLDGKVLSYLYPGNSIVLETFDLVSQQTLDASLESSVQGVTAVDDHTFLINDHSYGHEGEVYLWRRGDPLPGPRFSLTGGSIVFAKSFARQLWLLRSTGRPESPEVLKFDWSARKIVEKHDWIASPASQINP